jgi:uncharacterized protein (DUF342 family)
MDHELTQALAAAGVSFGVDDARCAEVASALGDPEYQTDCVIAHAVHPTLGVPGRFVPAFQAGIQPGHVRPDGSMDFFDRELLKPVASGELLGTLLPARPGTPGQRVDGLPIAAAKVHDAQLALGDGVRREPDGQLHAVRSGVLTYVADKSIDVVGALTHAGDVDLRSGHLTMQGSLRVQKNVLRPFEVRATGDVEVLGRVDGGSVQAGGSIRIKGVAQGASLVSDGDVSLSHAERAIVHCAGLLQVQTAVNCQLHAERLEVAGKLRGGSVSAEVSVLASELGSGAAETLVAAAIPLVQPDAVVWAIGAAKAERAAALRTGASGRDKGGKLGRIRASLSADSLERKLAQAATRERLLSQAFVEVRGTAHAGVTIQLGATRLTLEQPTVRTRFSMDLATRSIRSERIEP